MSQNGSPSLCRSEVPGNVPLHIAVTTKREAPAAGRDDHRDLCCICTYHATCMYRGDPKQPKLCCELFDVDVPALTLCAPAAHGNAEDIELKGGLCYNCENRKTCTIRGVQGDVWHCEEYC
jgi:hypothetical protein